MAQKRYPTTSCIIEEIFLSCITTKDRIYLFCTWSCDSLCTFWYKEFYNKGMESICRNKRTIVYLLIFPLLSNSLLCQYPLTQILRCLEVS